MSFSVIQIPDPLATTSAFDSAAPISTTSQPQVSSPSFSLPSTSNILPHPNATPLSQQHSSSSLNDNPPHILPVPPHIGHPMLTRSKYGIFKPKSYLTALLAQPSEPFSVTQALSDPLWFKALQEEFQPLQANHT